MDVFSAHFASSILLPLLVASSGGTLGKYETTLERVDLIELNHHYDDLGRHNYDQVIYYEWSPEYSRYHVIAWSLVDEKRTRIPRRVPGTRQWYVRWTERGSSVPREVRSHLFRETWSQIDPESANKELLAEKYRLSLSRPVQR